MCYLLLENGLHLLVGQVIRDGVEKVLAVFIFQRAAALRESAHDGLVMTEDLQAGQEERFTLATRHHHLTTK